MSTLQELQDAAMTLRGAYAELETACYGRPWSREEVALGFVGDVGDLMKLVQAAEGVRSIAGSEAKLAHELADCLWSVLVLAKLYGVDLERAFLETVSGLQQQIGERLTDGLKP